MISVAPATNVPGTAASASPKGGADAAAGSLFDALIAMLTPNMGPAPGAAASAAPPADAEPAGMAATSGPDKSSDPNSAASMATLPLPAAADAEWLAQQSLAADSKTPEEAKAGVAPDAPPLPDTASTPAAAGEEQPLSATDNAAQVPPEQSNADVKTPAPAKGKAAPVSESGTAKPKPNDDASADPTRDAASLLPAALAAAAIVASETSAQPPGKVESSDAAAPAADAVSGEPRAAKRADQASDAPSRAKANAERLPAKAAPPDSNRPASEPDKTSRSDGHGAQAKDVPAPASHTPAAQPAPAAPTIALNHALVTPSAPPVASASHETIRDAEIPLALTTASAQQADMDGLALRIAAKSASGESNFHIRLDPPELGRIDIHLNMDSQGNAQANLSADKPQTLDLLQKDAGALERALKDAGLDLAGGLSFSLKGEGKQGGWRDSQGSGRTRELQIVAGTATTNDAAATGARLYGQSGGIGYARLDIRV